MFVTRQGQASQAGAEYLLAGILLFPRAVPEPDRALDRLPRGGLVANLLNFMTTPCNGGSTPPAWPFCSAWPGGHRPGRGVLAAFGFTVLSIFDVGWALIPIGSVLLIAGWSISLFVIGLVLRFGQSAEVMAWGSSSS